MFYGVFKSAEEAFGVFKSEIYNLTKEDCRKCFVFTNVKMQWIKENAFEELYICVRM